mmetsp:Transcript_50959/g.94392  ORF Transcript_50959/g.94392 Transcript_50959/m.94392 type:complete len:163 (-) Transcript_50959:426-914(-)
MKGRSRSESAAASSAVQSSLRPLMRPNALQSTYSCIALSAVGRPQLQPTEIRPGRMAGGTKSAQTGERPAWPLPVRRPPRGPMLLCRAFGALSPQPWSKMPKSQMPSGENREDDDESLPPTELSSSNLGCHLVGRAQADDDSKTAAVHQRVGRGHFALSTLT